MNSRDKILQKLRNNQPELIRMPELIQFQNPDISTQDRFETILRFIGGTLVRVKNHAEIMAHIAEVYPGDIRIVTTVPELFGIAEEKKPTQELHKLANVELAVIKGKFGVAENGAIWVTAQELGGERVLPFICQHLSILLDSKDIVPGMYEAYQLIGTDDYEFGTFIAGPSKTADIEQSLVLGAHGAKTMTIFLVENPGSM